MAGVEGVFVCSGDVMSIRVYIRGSFAHTIQTDSPPAPPRIHTKSCSNPKTHLGWPMTSPAPSVQLRIFTEVIYCRLGTCPFS